MRGDALMCMAMHAAADAVANSCPVREAVLRRVADGFMRKVDADDGVTAIIDTAIRRDEGQEMMAMMMHVFDEADTQRAYAVGVRRPSGSGAFAIGNDDASVAVAVLRSAVQEAECGLRVTVAGAPDG